MIKYIGNFNDIENEYIESQVKEDSIIIKQNPFSPLFSLEEVVQYVKNKINQNTLKVYYFNKHKLQQIITPAMFVCNLLNDTIETPLLLPENCIIYIQQGCSENCICTSAYKCKFSVPYKDIKQQILDLPQNEFISLYGINVGDYDCENTNIIDLCKKILIEFPDKKIILCNISPFSPILKNLVEYMKEEPRILPVLYICINSGSQKILDIEGHKNINNDLNEILLKTNIKIIPYLIVGSPEEDESDFNETIKWVENHRDIILGAIILPYTVNGIGNCNQTISIKELMNRLNKLNEIVLNNSIKDSNIDLSKSLLKNILEVAICGEDHRFYRRYKNASL